MFTITLPGEYRPSSISRGNNAWPVRMPLRTSRISHPPLVGRKPVWKPKKNMFTITFVRSIDLVTLLNINGSFYNTAVIKQNNMTCQPKIIFLHSGRVWVWVWGGYLYTRYPSHTHVLKSWNTQTHTQTQSKRKKSVKLSLVRADNHEYEFCCHAYI